MVFSGWNVMRSAPLWRETGAWRRRCRSIRPLSPSTAAALLPFTATASRRMPGQYLWIRAVLCLLSTAILGTAFVTNLSAVFLEKI